MSRQSANGFPWARDSAVRWLLLMIPALLIAGTAARCGDSPPKKIDAEPIQTPQVTSGRWRLTYNDLGNVGCGGNPIPEAHPYVGSRHPLLAITDSGATDSGAWGRWDGGSLPATTIQLVACVKELPPVSSSCGSYNIMTYSGEVNGNLIQDRERQRARVFVARTGALLDETVLEAESKPCPSGYEAVNERPPWHMSVDVSENSSSAYVSSLASKAPPPASPSKRPLSAARLQGDYDVRYRITHSSNYAAKVGKVGNYAWHFQSRCSHDRCSGADFPWGRAPDVSDGAYTGDTYEATLPLQRVGSRGGATYQGSFYNMILAQCNGSDLWPEPYYYESDSDKSVTRGWGLLNIRLHVTKAAWIAGVWRARSWAGDVSYSWDEAIRTYEHSDDDRVCPAGQFTASLVGVFKRP
jgi:hypothetical protein